MRQKLRHIYLSALGWFMKPKPGIYIINSHYVTAGIIDLKRDLQIFDKYLSNLNKCGHFITLEDATDRIIQGNIPTDKTLITFTFDDGFEECYTIIAPLLEKYNTRGAFFINANYIESATDYQERFNQRTLTFSKKPMTWEQVRSLHQRGHLIGSHNLDHTNFAELDDNEIEYQTKENKNILESKLNYQCDYFAWTYGQLQHFPINALQIVKKHHPYIFSGTNYKKYFSFNREVINRRHQEAFWPTTHNKYFISIKKQYETSYRCK